MTDPARRNSLFLDAVRGVAGERVIRWHTYVSDYEIDDTGMVSFFPRRMDTDCGGGLDDMLTYCDTILGQGFYMELGIVDGDPTEFHLVSWESDDVPCWDSPDLFAVTIRV